MADEEYEDINNMTPEQLQAESNRLKGVLAERKGNISTWGDLGRAIPAYGVRGLERAYTSPFDTAEMALRGIGKAGEALGPEGNVVGKMGKAFADIAHGGSYETVGPAFDQMMPWSAYKAQTPVGAIGGNIAEFGGSLVGAKGIRRGITPLPGTPERNAAAAILKTAKAPYTAAERSGSRTAAWFEGGTPDRAKVAGDILMREGGAPRTASTPRSKTNRDLIHDRVLDARHDFNALDTVKLPISKEVHADLKDKVNEHTRDYMGSDIADPAVVQGIKNYNAFTKGGTITGKQARKLISDWREADPPELRKMGEILQNHVETTNPEFAVQRQNYAEAKALEAGGEASKAPNAPISYNAVADKGGNTPYGRLAGAMQDIYGEAPKPRIPWAHGAGGAALGGLIGYHFGGGLEPGVWSSLVAPGLIAGAGYGGRKITRSWPVQKYLKNTLWMPPQGRMKYLDPSGMTAAALMQAPSSIQQTPYDPTEEEVPPQITPPSRLNEIEQ